MLVIKILHFQKEIIQETGLVANAGNNALPTYVKTIKTFLEF